MLLTDTPLRDVLNAFSSSDPTPGGGSAAALASATGVSLLLMVAALPKTRTGTEPERAALISAAPLLTALRDRLTAAIDADSAAYDRVVAAYQLTKASPEEQQARKDAIQSALKGATDVPLEVVRLSAEALTHAATVAAHGHAGAASDVGVAIALLRAGLHGARLNVAINIDGIRDDAYVKTVREEVDQRSREAEAATASANDSGAR
jgi:formiminotetrahydrofolate cyclodeaminase